MLASTDDTTRDHRLSLQRAVRSYSLKEKDGKLVEDEVTSGLRVTCPHWFDEILQ